MTNTNTKVKCDSDARHAQAAQDPCGSASTRRSTRWSIGVAVLLAGLACAATQAMQAADPTVPPQPDKGLNLYSPVGGYALMALATAAVIAVNLMPAKRGHLD